MTTIYVMDTLRRDAPPVAREVLSKPGAKYLRIDARMFGLPDRTDAYFRPALGREAWPQNKGTLWGGERLYAFASMTEYHERIEVRARCEALVDAAHAAMSGSAPLTLAQLRQACAHLGVTYKQGA